MKTKVLRNAALRYQLRLFIAIYQAVQSILKVLYAVFSNMLKCICYYWFMLHDYHIIYQPKILLNEYYYISLYGYRILDIKICSHSLHQCLSSLWGLTKIYYL